ncbi:MAG TPA: sugar phosphate isomerase/epimerase [Steroidobacteraceae bacterium]|nr:sugar phosphate isomerase/epimerase [Steroidobacteraceae bacterium]
MKGPGIFLAQFAGTQPPFDSLEGMAKWAASLGYVGVQVPTSDPGLFDLQQAAQSQTYCDEIRGRLARHGIEITELSTHLQGQLLAVHPAYAEQFKAFAAPGVRENPSAWPAWATEQLKWAAQASARLGLKAHATFSGALLWPFMYPWPQRPDGLVEEGFRELARRWRPVLDAFRDAGVAACFEIHPGEDLHDGATFERFLDAVDQHPAASILYDPSHFVLQQLDYLAFIDLYHERIHAFHVKDAEFHPNGRMGLYGGYSSWVDRPGRFRSPGDGQIDFRQIFSKFAQYRYDGWAVLEWECCLKASEDGAREGAPFIREHMIRTTDKRFDDFAATGTDAAANRRILGL